MKAKDNKPSSPEEIASVHVINEPPCGKTNNVVSDQVRHKPTCTVTEKS